MKATAKATSNATATAKTADKAKAVAAVKVSAAIIAAIGTAATAKAAETAAIKASEKQVVKLGTLVGADKQLSKLPRADVQAALKPHFVKAYGEESYAVQQLSRVLTIAFPGGQKASEDDKVKAAANMKRAIDENKDTQTILGLASGKLAYTKKGEIAKTGKRRQGGSNRKTPLETFNAAIETAVTAANVGKVPPLAMIVGVLSALVACEAIESEEADTIEAAAKKAL